MSVRGSLPVIGIVGGIGSGKSSVAKHLGATRQLLILDGDRVGHDLFQDKIVLKQIHKHFGDNVVDIDSGVVNRKALATRVFGQSPEHRDSLENLEAILHPRIRSEFEKQILNANQAQQHEAIILDAALLLEAGWQNLCSAVVFVDTPFEIRQQRVIDNRGWTEDELTRRESNQLSIEQKKQLSSHIIDNSGSLEAASVSLNAILDQVLRQNTSQNIS